MDRLFITIVISLSFLCAGYIGGGSKTIAMMLIPDIMCRHNFVSTFFALYLLIPFINKAISHLGIIDYRGLIIAVTVLICIWPTVMWPTGWFVDNVFSYLGVMVYLYLLGGYLRIKIEQKRRY